MKRSESVKILLAIWTLIAASCSMKDDRNDCPSGPQTPPVVAVDAGLRVHITYEDNSIPEDLNTVDHLTVFIFDETGTYLDAVVDTDADLSRDFFIAPTLEPGVYDFVVWANLDYSPAVAREIISGESTIEELYVELLTEDDEFIAGDVAPLYYGRLDNAVVTGEEGIQDLYIYLDDNSYRINLYTVGFEPEEEEDFHMYITGMPSSMGVRSRSTDYNYVSYYNICNKTQDKQIETSMLVLWLDEEPEEATLALEGKATGTRLFDDNLLSLLRSLEESGKDLDLKTTHEFTIVLRFSGGIVTEVEINGWTIVYDDIELASM